MTAIDFPASPTNGQQFTAASGVTYIWLASPGIWYQTASPIAFVGVTPPSSPGAGQMWFNSDNSVGGGTLYVWYVDPNTSQWVPASPAAAPAVLVPKVTKYPANGSWTPDPQMVHGYAVAKGGGGGSATITVDPTYVYGGGGGGEGATVTKYFKAGDYIGAQTVTIGAGGVASGVGSASSIAAWLVASGGGASANTFNGGLGGTTGTGDIVILGAAGGSGSVTNVSAGLYGAGGVGGGAGGGVGAVYTANGGVPGSPGAANSGGGGGGASSRAAGPGAIGGVAGGSGYVYVVEYVRA